MAQVCYGTYIVVLTLSPCSFDLPAIVLVNGSLDVAASRLTTLAQVAFYVCRRVAKSTAKK